MRIPGKFVSLELLACRNHCSVFTHLDVVFVGGVCLVGFEAVCVVVGFGIVYCTVRTRVS